MSPSSPLNGLECSEVKMLSRKASFKNFRSGKIKARRFLPFWRRFTPLGDRLSQVFVPLRSFAGDPATAEAGTQVRCPQLVLNFLFLFLTLPCFISFLPPSLQWSSTTGFFLFVVDVSYSSFFFLFSSSYFFLSFKKPQNCFCLTFFF